MKILACIIVLFLLQVSAQQTIPFSKENWNFIDAQTENYLGRESLKGTAMLKDVEFKNGIIEFDLAVNGERSYPGIIFRAKNLQNYERIYIRPHLPKVFQNVIQYEGTFNGIDSWQLYYGDGKTASASFPFNQWFHIKIEIKNLQARIYLNNSELPVLTINNLVHGITAGGIGVFGPKDGTAYYSNFSYSENDNISFDENITGEEYFGFIKDWEICQPFRLQDVDFDKLPLEQSFNNIKWQKITAQPDGLVDISRYFGRIGQTPDVIWAKTIIKSDKNQSKQFAFGYSDVINVFLNGKQLFSGNSSYTSRDANFQGIIGLNDYINLDLKEGDNELVIALAESFGGWGFMFRDVAAIYEHKDLEKIWEIKNQTSYPESAVYDSKRDVLYVSSFTYENGGFISRISLDGKVEKKEWVKGILQPTGLSIVNDKLYVVGRYNLIEIDIPTETINARYPFPAPVFPNDITADEDGSLYITDGGKGSIYKFKNGEMSEWINNKEFIQINAITIKNKDLYVGVSRTGMIKKINTTDQKISDNYRLKKNTVIDGLCFDNEGNLLIGDHSGIIYRLDTKTQKELLINTKAKTTTLADFTFIPEKNILIIPTLEENSVIAYKINK